MKILVLDNNNSLLELAREYLSHMGVEEIYLYKNTSNLNNVTLNNFDIFIVELEQMETILKEPDYNESLVISKTIIMAGDMNSPFIKNCYDAGFRNFIHKPFGMYNFISTVGSVIAHDENTTKITELESDLKGKETLASVGEVAGKIAHEINNPITCVGTNIESLRDYMKSIKLIIENYRTFKELCRKHTKVEAFVKRIQNLDNLEKDNKIDFVLNDLQILIDDTYNGTQRITNIVKNIKTFIRQSADTDKTLNDFTEIVEESVKTVKRVMEKEEGRHVEFVEDLSLTEEIECNSLLIYQVLVNIMTNSVQAIRGMKDEREGKITVKTYAEDKYLVCTISDNGPGMPENIKKRIFEPFFTTKGAGVGTGLGLSISKDIIVKKHLGEIELQSEQDEGTTFIIKIPFRDIEK